jgi:iron(III) transport system substrate-binding protein
LAVAKEEGKVVIYGRGDPEVRKELQKTFTEKYGIGLDFTYFPRGGEMAAKIKKERAAGLYIADVIIHGPTTMTNLLKPAGLLDPLEPLLILPEVKEPKFWRPRLYFIDKDRMMKPMRAGWSKLVVCNTNLVKEGEMTSHRDLLDPKWKGKIVMYDPTRPGAGDAFVALLHLFWPREQAVAFLKQLAKQEPVITRDLRLPVEWVARGKYAIGIGLRAEAIPEFLKLGAPVALLRLKEGCLLAPGAGNIAVVKKRPHPNATTLFVNWILSREGATAWSKADSRASARVDVPTDWVHPMYLPEPGEKAWVEDEEAYKRHLAHMRLCKEIFGHLLK